VNRPNVKYCEHRPQVHSYFTPNKENLTLQYLQSIITAEIIIKGFVLLIIFYGAGVGIISQLLRPFIGLLYQPWMMDDG
jgi:hypothetical protein